ncbi:MFS transporter [Gordonia sp. JH63]|uniref:MFS transporter n=1 Tax=Gordonia TaxID=2053 RepID=UPI00080DE02B|nr:MULTISPECIES: MFS transporter [Gordonia]OCH82609.1 transporter [Gordonia sp. UCD-TK1]QHD87273.1 MFS transporter [Gordonia sp. JH63]UPG67650.1 MHS family MFS transporter [Gordonia hongkongensis]
MVTLDNSAPPDPSATGTGRPRRERTTRVAVASGVGTIMEFYDFAIYGTATALVFNKIFFNVDDPWFGTFLGFATFAVGFVMAPIGALIFGHFGDKFGRRKALTAAFLLMGGSTLAMGVLPDYQAIGIVAPIILVFLRMVHGISRGGEIGGAALLAAEHAPTHRRGLYGCFVTLGSPVGGILANLSFALVLLMPMEQVLAWGWRIPFLIGGVVLAIGVWTRSRVSETPDFVESKQAEEKSPPAFAVLRQNWRRVALAAGINVGQNCYAFLLFTFMLSFLTETDPGRGFDRSPVVFGSTLALACHAATVVLGSYLSDRLGRKTVIGFGMITSLLFAPILFSVTASGSLAACITVISIGFALTGFVYGPMLTTFAELFPITQRYSGIGIGFQVGAVLGGGLAPMIANRIVSATGSVIPVGFYAAALMAISLCCLMVIRETAPALAGRPTLRQRLRS